MRMACNCSLLLTNLKVAELVLFKTAAGVIAAVIMIFAAQTPARAQFSNAKPQDIEKIAAIAQEVGKIYQGFLEAISDADNLDSMFYALIEKKADQQFAMQQSKVMLTACLLKLDRLSNDTKNVNTADVRIPEFVDYFNQFADYSNEMLAYIRTRCTDSANLINTYSTDVQIDHDMRWKNYYNRTKIIILGENKMVASGLLLIPTEHPQKSLIRVIIATNEIVLSLLDVLNLGVYQKFGGDEFYSYLGISEIKLKEAQNYIAQGQQEKVSLRNNIDRQGSVPPQKQARLREFFLSYEKSFDIETQILDMLRNIIDDAKTNVSDPQTFMQTWDYEFQKISVLLASRLQVDTNRKGMIRELFSQ